MVQTSKTIKIGKYVFSFWQVLGLFIAVFFFVAAYGFRHNIFKALINPKVPFQVDEQGKAPDFSDASAWAKRPQNIAENRLPVFFIHPTTYYDGSDGWNASIDNADARKNLTKKVIPNFVMPFAKHSDIFMPYYRQATLLATLAFNEDTKDALEFAYGDVETAFGYFIDSIGPNRPFAIVGINQGALHASRLLQSKIANSDLEKRLVSAYLIDVAIPIDEFTPQNFGKLSLCNNKQAFNCIMVFHILDESDKRSQYLFRKRAPVFSKSLEYAPLNKRTPICTNPLNGGSAPNAEKELNLGSVSANELEDETMPPFLPHETGAQCKNGMLLVDDDRSRALKPKTLELGTAFKTTNYNLFYDAMENELTPRLKSYNVAANAKN